MDPNRTLSSSSYKKRKLQQDDDDHSKKEERKTNSNVVDKEAAAYTKRWMQYDRRRALHLWKHFGAATYRWDETKMNFAALAEGDDDDDDDDNDDNNTNLNNVLTGEYDIIFCYGEPGSTDQGWMDGPISRTVSQGKLTMASREIPAGDYFYDEGREILYGTIDNVARAHVRDDAGWECSLQMDNVEFRQFPNDFFGTPGPTFCITQNEGCDSADEYEVTIRILQNEGTLDWTPNEAILLAKNDNDRGDEEHYARFLRESIARRNHIGDESSWWTAENSWLCRYMGIGPDAALKICNYNMQPAPAPTWAWHPGDLVLKFEMTDYATSWDTIYVARRRTTSTTTAAVS